MTALVKLWSENTNEFTTIQKAVIGLTLTFIVTTSFIALALLSLEFMK